MISRNRPARIAAAVVAGVAGVAAMLAVTTTASADEPGRCLQNVNVREEPEAGSRIVALCEADTPVKLGEERDGFVRIDELGGWAAAEYVKADATSSGDDGSSGSSGERSGGDGRGFADEPRSADDDGEHPGRWDDGSSDEVEPSEVTGDDGRPDSLLS